MRKGKIYLGLISVLLVVAVLAIPAMAAERTDSPAVVADTSGWEGFHQNPDTGEWCYYKNGAVSTETTDVIQDTNGTIGAKGAWWNVVKGKVTPGVTVARNENGWWYIDEKGMVDFNANTVAKNQNGWWYVIDGKVQFGFTGLANYSNENGWWYIREGKVDFNHNGVDKNKNGWWYVTDGKVQFGFTGLANYSNVNGWWYIREGKVDFNHNGVDKNNNGWWYVTDGKVQFGFTGLANYSNVNGWWYIREGKVDFTHNGVDKNNNGWWYVENGKVNFDYTGNKTLSGKSYAISGGRVTGFAAPAFTVTRGASSTTVNWSSVGAEKYRVFRKTYGGSWTQLADTTSTSYTDNTQVRGTNYYYTVRCVDAAGSAYTSSYISSYSGSEIVSYARQFLGNPYVWDGLSLTNGCDCSGFVAGVYGHFGVSMPHYSFKQAEAGYAVSYANAKQGDLIFYHTNGPTGGHIGIYVGNGQMISAKNSSEGICIHSVDSSASGFTVRRIF